VFVNVLSGSARDMRVSVAYDGPLRAPIKAGAQVATLLVEFPGGEPARIPLLAETSVEEAGFFRRIWNGVTGWFA
jgi:D-alanyl-D-alanine carboxypeptidase (penicillin-binding protein 5/6)